MKKCPKCNLLIDNDSAKFCKKCGTNIENEQIVAFEHPEVVIQCELKEEPSSNSINEMNSQAPPISKYTYTPEINGFFSFVLWMIVVGGILTPIVGIAAFDESSYADSLGLLMSDLSIYILTPFYAIYSVVSTYKRRSGSVILLKAYLMSIMVYKLLLLLITGFAYTEASDIGGIIWNLVFLLYISLAEKVKDNFPKETRKASTFDKILIWSYIIIPLFTFIVGFLELMLYS